MIGEISVLHFSMAKDMMRKAYHSHIAAGIIGLLRIVGSLDVELPILDNPITYRALTTIVVDTYLEETLAIG